MLDYCERCGSTGSILTTDFRTRVPCDAPGCKHVRSDHQYIVELFSELRADMREASALARRDVEERLEALAKKLDPEGKSKGLYPPQGVHIDVETPKPPPQPACVITKRVHRGCGNGRERIEIGANPHEPNVRVQCGFKPYFEAEWLWMTPPDPLTAIVGVWDGRMNPFLSERYQRIPGAFFERFTFALPQRPLVGWDLHGEALTVEIEWGAVHELTLYLGGQYVGDVESYLQGRRLR